MLVFETDEFKSEARQHGVWEHALRTSERIRSAMTRVQVADCVGKYYAQLLVDKQANLRLIGDIRRMDDGEDVFLWLRVLVRGGTEYETFGRQAERIRSSFDRQALEDWYQEQRRLHDESMRPPQLPADLHPWLEAPREIGSSGDLGYLQVFESADWVRGILETRRELWADIYAAIRRVVDEIEAGLGIEIGISHREYDPHGRVGVECFRPDGLSLFLTGIVSEQQDASFSKDVTVDRWTAARTARRSYPAWILIDREQWFEIQDQKESNLSLSPEERRLLDTVSGHGVSDHQLPLFINGQAGSGKSTMLAYIFAGLLARQERLSLGGKPLFITYNEHLLDRASETAAQLMKYDANFLRKDQTLPSGSFVTWRDFLIGLLPPEKVEDFDPGNRVDFHDFKLSWERRGGRLGRYDGNVRKSAEFVWFVIKALIKGSDSLEDLTPEEFPTLAGRDQTVSIDEFTEIYGSAYLTWYAPAARSRGLWDDQDLVSAVLAELKSTFGNSRPVGGDGLVALVVDEAQDFTRRELRLLTRLLVFANYQFPQYGNSPRIPLVLAGDPLQTLSPTGFDWSRIKAAVTEEFELLFGPAAKVPELEVLNFNYRSAEPIVQVGNSVQLWRRRLFELDGIRAQSAWNPATALRHPEKFLFSHIREDDFIRFARDTVIVVPCDEGGEEDFISRDPTLLRMFQSEKDLVAEGFVFSPVGIKGLEFKKVILYKFGEACPAIEWALDDSRRAERDLEAEYFFNKLYVAVSRATELLFVVDTDDGDERLWSNFSVEALNRLSAATPKSQCKSFSEGSDLAVTSELDVTPETIRSLLGHIEVGAELRDVQEENPKAVADDIRRYGMETRNPTKMRQAAAYYRRSANLELATECEAYALRYEDRVLEAAELFERSRRFDQSWECRWEKSDWTGLSEIAERVSVASALQRVAVRLMGTPSLEPKDLLVLHEVLRSERQLPRTSEPQWVALSSRLASTQTNEMADLGEDELENIVMTLERLFEHGFRQVGPLLARALLGLGNTERALQVAEQSSGRLDPTLAAEIADSIGFPLGLRTLERAGLHEEILEAWDIADRPAGSEWHSPVMAALQALRRPGEVIDLLLDQGRYHQAADLLAELCETGQQRNDDRVVEVIEGLAGDGSLHEAFDLLDRLYEVAAVRAALPKAIVLRSRAAVAWARAEEERGWQELGAHTRTLLESPASRMRDACRRNDVRAEDVPATLALVELVLGRAQAMGLCGLYARADVRSPDLRRYARDRYLAMAAQEIDLLNARPTGSSTGDGRALANLRLDRQARAKEWGYSSFNVPNLRRAVLGDRLAQVDPKGERHGVSWEVDSTDKGQRVELQEGDEWLLRYSITDRRVERAIGISHDERLDGVTAISRNGVIISVMVGEITTLSFSVESEQPELIAVHRSQVAVARQRQSGTRGRRARRGGRPSSGAAGRTARNDSSDHVGVQRASGSIKAHKLARELGVALSELNARAVTLGLARRNGNATFSAEEADKIRLGR